MSTSQESLDNGLSILCDLCGQFSNDLVLQHEDIDAIFASNRWFKAPTGGPFGPNSFRHCTTFEDLIASGQTCSLCRIIGASFEGKKPFGSASHSLFPWTQYARARFSAAFDDTRSALLHWSIRQFGFGIPPPHTFMMGYRKLYAKTEKGASRAVPARFDGDSLATAEFWLDDCFKNHFLMPARARSSPEPRY
jgi:hypothetical protein